MSRAGGLKPPIKVASSVKGIYHRDSVILVTECTDAAITWKTENPCLVPDFTLDLVQQDDGVAVKLM